MIVTAIIELLDRLPRLLFTFIYCKHFIFLIYIIKPIKMNVIAIVIFIFSHAKQCFS